MRYHRFLAVVRPQGPDEVLSSSTEWLCRRCGTTVWSYGKPRRRPLRKAGFSWDCDEQAAANVLSS